MMRCVILFCAFALLTSAALGHHGWGSYDASKPVTVTDEIRAERITVNGKTYEMR